MDRSGPLRRNPKPRLSGSDLSQAARGGLKNSTIRSLQRGEKVPDSEPRRYAISNTGYMRLRWKVGVRQYVETYEHRVVDGYITDAEHVHHKNRVRDDNRPENLEFLSADEHADEHGRESHERALEMAALYEQGLSIIELGRRFSLDTGAISRRLRDVGVVTAPFRRDARPVDREELARLYAGGRSVQSLASQFHITSARVSEEVKAAGGTMRRPGRPKTHSRMGENRARLLLAARSHGLCEVCGDVRSSQFQHRKAQGQGGPWDVANGLAVCGAGNYAGCHGYIHQNPTEAYEMGWSVRREHDFLTQKVWTAHSGWVFLLSDGGLRPADAQPIDEPTDEKAS